MTWRIEFSARAEKQLDRLDPAVRVRILKTLKRSIATGDPRGTANALAGEWTGFWRYRVGDYRVIVRIEDETVTVFVIEVGHRREIYR